MQSLRHSVDLDLPQFLDGMHVQGWNLQVGPSDDYGPYRLCMRAHGPFSIGERLTQKFQLCVHLCCSAVCLVWGVCGEVGVSKNRGPQNRPQYITILIIRTPKEGPLILAPPK